MRTIVTTNIEDPKSLKQQLLEWSKQFREILFLDSNNYPQHYTSYDAIVAVDAFTSIQTDCHDGFEKLKEYQQITKDWLFGYLTYDLKNDTENLKSDNGDRLAFPDLFFFQPKKLLLLKGNSLELHYLNMCDDELEQDLSDIAQAEQPERKTRTPITIQQRISKEEYDEKVKQMLSHITKGDIYEANLCMEFYAENAVIDPMLTFQKLNEISLSPFAAFFKNNQHFALCASPERYIKKVANKIISQPIKGTAKRSTDEDEDALIKTALSENGKERSENIMITDLVRNDLSKTASKGTVEVEELCGVYTFKQVHHLISTIVSTSTKLPTDILRTTFPMGSMTGAPKIAAMKIIENLEETKRGLYSGAIGYFTPENDFDFNVVIRSILYNQREKYLSFSVGSAITSLSDPDQEYEECLLKAKAMRNVLTD